ncbi:MAG: hypothetical protein AAF484_17330 [Pseudomonadota bacterium]
MITFTFNYDGRPDLMRFRPLRLTFGPGEEALRGLHCDPEPMQSIPEDAGFTVFVATSNEDG